MPIKDPSASRMNLMKAIQEAGGAGKAKLRRVSDRDKGATSTAGSSKVSMKY